MYLPFYLSTIWTLVLRAAASTNPDPVDHTNIHQVLNRYAVAIDRKAYNTLDEVFTPDITADYGPNIGVLRGLGAVKTGLARVLKPVMTHHAQSTQLVDVHPITSAAAGPKSANATTYFSSSQFGTGKYEGQAVYSYGMYEDQLVTVQEGDMWEEFCEGRRRRRRGFVWTIRERTVVYTGPTLGNLSIFTGQ